MSSPAIPLDAIGEPVFVYDEAGLVAAANPAAERLAGASTAGLSAGGLADLLALRLADGRSPETAQVLVRKALGGEEFPPLLGEITAADGSTVGVVIVTYPIRDGGRITGALSIWHDMTGRERLRGELAESEAKYRNLVDLSPDAILIHQDGLIVFANPAAAALLGHGSPADLVGRPVLGIVHPGRREHVEWNIAADLRGEESPITVVEILRPDGTTVTVQGRGAMIPFGGRPAVQVVLRDVTDLERAEEALRDREQTLQGIFRAAPVGIGMVSHRTITQANDQLCRMTGYAREELIGRDARLFYLDDESYEFVGREKYARIAANGFGAVETQWRRRDGTIRDILLSSSPVDLSRPNENVIFNALDITKLRESERALASYMDDLERSNEELQRFAYVASHDLQEPLRSIVSFSQLLERRYKGKLDQDADEFIAFIIEGGNRMQRLIEDLLQLSRVETKAKPLVPTDAGEVVADALRLMETSIREAGATVAVGDLPTVRADAAQLAQVVTNLVGNALKYHRPGVPPEIRISAERAGEFWRFSVADNGIGIEAEYFDRIFVIFQRLHTRDEYEGTGIGLAVARKIVERHGGRVWVESTPGEGSTFSFTLQAA